MGLIWVLAPLHLSCVTLGKLLLFSEMHCSLMEKTLILKIIVNISNSILGLSYIIISMPFLFHYSFNNLENISALLKFKLFWFGTLPTWQNYDNVEGSICSAKISRIRVILFTLIQILSQQNPAHRHTQNSLTRGYSQGDITCIHHIFQFPVQVLLVSSSEKH